MIEQIRVVFLKNFKLLVRSKTFIQSIYIPILCTLFSILGARIQSFQILKDLLPIYQIMAINGYIRYASMEIVQEKKEQQRENQKIMGLTHWNYMVGQLSFSILVCLILGLFYFTATYIGGVYEGIQFSKGLALYTAFIIAIVCQLYFITSFFTNQKLASDLLTSINLFFSFIYMIVYFSDFGSHKFYLMLISLSPQAALSISFISEGWLADKEDPEENVYINFSMNTGFFMLLLDIGMYLFLYLYIDQVWPNEYGTQKNPFFIFQSLKKLLCKQKSQQEQIQPNSNYDQFNDIEMSDIEQNQNIPKLELISQDFKEKDKSSAVFHQQIDISNMVKSIEINNLTKHYSGYYAVKQLSLTLYEGQIFCLLGHNGAGKTTVINLLSGMIQKSNGKIIMNGLDLDEDLDQIRRCIGLCSQRNILYDNLTVEDHLWYYGRIKLINEEVISSDIQYIIEKCNLQNERYKYAQHLSGGNKRKLCLAIALIGQSKLIFLDEPTSGVDVVTRKQIWKILKEIKNEGRVIILTTHHLEEAEALADRIGIMAQGQLLCVGTVDFIIHKFGVGYFLKIQSKSDNDEGKKQFLQKKQFIESIIKQFIQNCQKDTQTQEHSIKYLLPFETMNKFSSLFSELEKEDVFVNIGLDEHKYLNQNQQQSQQKENEVVYSNFSNIQIPEFLKDEPYFSFQAQITVMAQRRIKLLYRNSIFLISYLFPLTIIGFGYFFANRAFNNFELFLLFSSIAICFLSNSTGNTFIIERERGLLYCLRVMGCKPIPYWIGTFIIDFLLSMLYLAIILGLVFGLNLRTFILDTNSQIVYKCFVTVFSGLATSYSYSYLFDKSYTAYMAFPFFQLFLNFFLGFFLIILSMKYSFLQLISYVFFPIGVNYVGTAGAEQTFTSIETLYVNIKYLNHIALASSICHLIVAIYLEKYQITQYCQSKKSYTPNQLSQREEDVIQEEQRSLCQTDPINAQRISKLYDTQVALNGISFGVQKKEIFGLLGPNGAGKTTTFNILTAKDSSSSGVVTVNNQLAFQTNQNAWQNVGICSQIDCLWEDLTVYDHLSIFASLKGLQGEKRERAIKYFIQTLQLDQYIENQTYTLSGGNKRKLCVAMALIGSPNVQFFDEPSSGLDPIAKRFLWNTLKQNLQLKDASIVLTTHSMNEAESLCQKIGILVNGQFACMGSPEHLSNKYGQGYRLKLIIQENYNIQEIDGIILNQFQNSKKIIEQEKTLIYQIPSISFIFSRVFDILENQLKNKVESYSIHYTNLEQIFQQFASFQQQNSDPQSSFSEQEIFNCDGINCIRWCTMCCCCCVW